jgi:hypothetical protein
MSLWTVVGISTQVEVSANGLTLTEPAGVANGDLLVACISYRSNAAFTAPSGWTNANAQNTGNTTANAAGSIGSARMDYQVRSGAPSLTWTRTGGDVARGTIIALRATGGTPVFDQASGTTLAANSTTASTTGITTVEDGEILVMLEGGARNITASNARATDPAQADWTEQQDNGSATGADVSLAVSTATKNELGATGTFNWTASATARHVTIVGAFRAKSNMAGSLGSFTLTGQSVASPFGVKWTATDSNTHVWSVSETQWTWSNANIGAAAADRIVLVGAADSRNGGLIDNITIGGVTATEVGDLTNSFLPSSGGWFYASLPTGTTANIVVNLNDDHTAGASVTLKVFALTGAKTPHFSEAENGELGDVETTIDISAKRGGATFGLGIGPATSALTATNPLAVWTGLTKEGTDLSFVGVTDAIRASWAAIWHAAVDTTYDVIYHSDGTSITEDDIFLTMIHFEPAGGVTTLVAAQGSFALNGQVATLRVARRLSMDFGSFALSGQAASLLYNRRLTSNFGAFSLTGIAVEFLKTIGFPVDYGSFALTGGEAILTVRLLGQWYPEGEGDTLWTPESGVDDNWTPENGVSGAWTQEATPASAWTPQGPPSNNWTPEDPL